MQIIVDKIASVTKNIPLKNTVSLTSNLKSNNGTVLAVEVLEDKKVYNQLELTSGRLSTLHKGDILIVALGERRALKGFVGDLPQTLHVGDIIHLLNMGGVAGICTSENRQEVGQALKMRVLGGVLDEKKQCPLNIKDYRLFEPAEHLKTNVPLIIISGTCMNVGKTSVICEILKNARKKNLTIFCAKLSGIAALRDTENMKDFGAKKAVSIIDAGYTSSVLNPSESIALTKGAINYLSQGKPDFIIIEFGDGILGEYGVLENLKDKELQQKENVHIGCAHDPVGALKLFEICRDIGAPLDIISGPVTDNSVGTKFIEKNLRIHGINALNQGKDIFEYVFRKLNLKR